MFFLHTQSRERDSEEINKKEYVWVGYLFISFQFAVVIIFASARPICFWFTLLILFQFVLTVSEWKLADVWVCSCTAGRCITPHHRYVYIYIPRNLTPFLYLYLHQSVQITQKGEVNKTFLRIIKIAQNSCYLIIIVTTMWISLYKNIRARL